MSRYRIARRRTPPFLAAALLAGSSLCAGSAPADDDVRIGAVLPVTGKESKIGGAFKVATEYAVKEANETGGLVVAGKRMKIDLRLLDDTSDAAKSAQLVEQLIAQQKVAAVLGGYGSQLVQAQSVVPERYGIPFVAGGAGASAIYGRSKWVFGTLSPVENLAETQMDFLADLVKAARLKPPLKIALVWENTEHGKDFQKGVRDFVKAHPKEFSIPLDESFELYAADFKPLLTRVAAAKADLFMCDAHLEDYISMHRTYTQMGLYHQMVTYGARGADEAGRKGLGAATDYIFASGWWSDLLPYPQVKSFVEKFKAATGVAPQWYHACAYETARALFAAIRAAGSLKPEAIRDALAKLELKDSILPGGVLRYSKTGQAILPFVVTQNKPAGKLDIVWPKDAKTGDAVAPIPR
ncbi:MAG TPA: amino acid ABC transporter substrate-binding protein [Thermoanaerobaculia bacterium]|nr:amino acid ABC transporter substrate-binding protein [Thermoanaerobaculia bacterium]HQR68452.1 amino acid ABC transporter substrate-binding protein [Thermoanaerobaculia bacterium]